MIVLGTTKTFFSLLPKYLILTAIEKIKKIFKRKDKAVMDCNFDLFDECIKEKCMDYKRCKKDV